MKKEKIKYDSSYVIEFDTEINNPEDIYWVAWGNTNPLQTIIEKYYNLPKILNSFFKR